MTSNDILGLVSVLNSGLLWVYFIIVIIGFYALVSLLTWNLKKPLMFLGIPTIIVGVFLIILRYSVGLFIPYESMLTIVNSAVKPLFTLGIISIIVGIIMIVVYKVLNRRKKKQNEK